MMPGPQVKWPVCSLLRADSFTARWWFRLYSYDETEQFSFSVSSGTFYSCDHCFFVFWSIYLSICLFSFCLEHHNDGTWGMCYSPPEWHFHNKGCAKRAYGRSLRTKAALVRIKLSSMPPFESNVFPGLHSFLYGEYQLVHLKKDAGKEVAVSDYHHLRINRELTRWAV